MQIIRTSIRNKILALLTLAMFVVLSTVFIGFSNIKSVMSGYSNTVNQEASLMSDVAALNISFKTQVQEWKNTLIRGEDVEQLDKYWGRFQQSAIDIPKAYSALLKKMPNKHPAKQHLNAFSQSYPKMIAAYQTGFNAYINAGKNITVADQGVKGIDRAPTKSLNSAVEAVNKNILGLKANNDKSVQSALLTTQIFILLVVVVILFCVSWFFNSRIVNPLGQIRSLSRDMAKGDLTGDITSTSQDEIGHVVSNFSQIQLGLSAVLSSIFKDIKGLGNIIENLFSAHEKLNVGLASQAKETTHLAKNMQELSDSNDSVSSAIGQANTLASNCVGLADEGQTMFKQNLDTSHNMLDATNHASDIIATLKADTDNIGNVVSVINGIAEQTNLLALNAAIEAARAGESGRGFAVVADEVRSLATKTQESTQQISDNISKLQTEADNAVKAMTQGKEQSEESLSQTQKSKEFVESLYSAIHQISELHNIIELEMSQQLQQTNTINHALVNIEQQSTQSQQEAHVMEQSSQKLADIYRSVESATKELKIR